MIYFWRVLAGFSLLNLMNIIAVDGGAGMEPVWVAMMIMSTILSFKKPLRYVFSHKSIKGLFFLGMTFFIIIESIIIFYSIKCYCLAILCCSKASGCYCHNIYPFPSFNSLFFRMFYMKYNPC